MARKAKGKATVRTLETRKRTARRVRGGIIIICRPGAATQKVSDVRVLKLGDGSV